MKLIVAIVHERSKQKVTDALLREGISYTKLGSAGGFLSQGNATLLVAVEEEQVERVLEIVRGGSRGAERFVPVADAALNSSPYGPPLGSVVSDTSGGAIAFVLNIEEFHRF
jgi:uncharacterized protein YaaQ